MISRHMRVRGMSIRHSPWKKWMSCIGAVNIQGIELHLWYKIIDVVSFFSVLIISSVLECSGISHCTCVNEDGHGRSFTPATCWSHDLSFHSWKFCDLYLTQVSTCHSLWPRCFHARALQGSEMKIANTDLSFRHCTEKHLYLVHSASWFGWLGFKKLL